MFLLFTITAKQISTVRGIGYKKARIEWQAIRTALGLDSTEPLKLRDLAGYYDLPPRDLAEMLYYVRKN